MVRRLLVALPAVCLLLLACGDDDDQFSGPLPTVDTPLEYQLASINAGDLVDDDDATIAQFGDLLDDLETLCPDSRQDIADLGVSSHELIIERGGSEPLLQTMQMVAQLLRDGTAIVEDDSCTAAFALWVIVATEES